VYWTTRTGEKAIKRALKEGVTGGEIEVLASGLPAPADLAVRGAFAAWVNQGDGSVMAIEK
jgi:hypothetical protein